MESKAVKICVTSDTHGRHGMVRVPPCDILIHCGDCTADSGPQSLRGFLVWFERQPAKHKVLVAGNHDFAFEKWPDLAVAMVKEVAPSVQYLQDSGCELMGLKFWGSPYQPEFMNWAFNLPSGAALKRHWDMIPKGTDVLVTHGPPKGFLDYNHYDNFHCGCEDLLNAVIEIKPKLHCFGHIHSGYGSVEVDGTIMVNASACNERYIVKNDPVTVYLTP